MAKNDLTVSIIIPVYNSEKYLNNLFNSLLFQSYTLFEVIIVDDGSIDETPIICKDWTKKDTRFQYFRKNNGGASSARNFGLGKASNDLIIFLDSDDSISNDFVESFVNAFKKTKADIVSFKIYIPNERRDSKHSFNKLIDSTDEIIDSFLKEEFGVGPTSKLFQKAKISNLLFNENLIINEDKLFLFEYLLQCNTAFVSSETKYYVNHRPDSISSSVNYRKKATDLLFVHKRINELIKEKQINSTNFKQHNIKNMLYIYKMYYISCNFLADYKNSFFEEVKQLINSGKKQRGPLKIRLRLELFLLNNFRFLYNTLLKKYYRRKIVS